jgi:hypothetical protein
MPQGAHDEGRIGPVEDEERLGRAQNGRRVPEDRDDNDADADADQESRGAHGDGPPMKVPRGGNEPIDPVVVLPVQRPPMSVIGDYA